MILFKLQRMIMLKWILPGRKDTLLTMKKTAYTVSLLILLTVLMSGCMYPDDNGQDIQVSYRESVKRIQSAVDDFYKEQSILPIINADADVPKYEKFRVDLDKLKGKGYIDEIPKTAFENGGSGYFLIINEETEPTVKVMDLNTKQKVNDVQLAVNRYKTANNGTLPTGEELYPDFYAIDFTKTDIKDIKLKSVYSGQEVQFMMDKAGNVYIDYAFDIMQAIDKETAKPKSDEDLRVYLEHASYFVPVKSAPYYWKDKQPVASLQR